MLQHPALDHSLHVCIVGMLYASAPGALALTASKHCEDAPMHPCHSSSLCHFLNCCPALVSPTALLRNLQHSLDPSLTASMNPEPAYTPESVTGLLTNTSHEPHGVQRAERTTH